MNGAKNVLIIAAHPDDEILGCGATISRMSGEGSRVHILILAEGITSREEARNRPANLEKLRGLAKTAHEAASAVGATSLELLDLPDNRMDTVPLLDVTKIIEHKIAQIQPTVVFTHFPGDLNIDHRITSQATTTACRPVPNQVVKEIYYFEIPSSTDWHFGITGFQFAPNYFVTVSEENLASKLSALHIYNDEMRPFPHSRSYEAVESLARSRGASAGVPAAEAFMLGRKNV